MIKGAFITVALYLFITGVLEANGWYFVWALLSLVLFLFFAVRPPEALTEEEIKRKQWTDGWSKFLREKNEQHKS